MIHYPEDGEVPHTLQQQLDRIRRIQERERIQRLKEAMDAHGFHDMDDVDFALKNDAIEWKTKDDGQ